MRIINCISDYKFFYFRIFNFFCSAEGIYLALARIGTIYYFLHFIVVLPVVGLLEKTDPIPMRISAPVLSSGADPALAKKDYDKI